MIIQNEIRDKILKGSQLAIDRLLEKKRRENSYVVISENGKVVKVKATDIDNNENRSGIDLTPDLLSEEEKRET